MSSREETCSYCGEKGHSIQQCPKWKGKGVAAATKEELTPYMREKIPLILSKLREAQKTMMVSKETLYDWVHPYVTKVAFDEIIAYLERKGEIFEPRPGFLKTTESSSSPREAGTFTDPLLGRCGYTGFYITNEMYGGYSANCEKGRISVDYANPLDVINLAEKALMPVQLAGGVWEWVGRKGWGETVGPSEAKKLLQELSQKRGIPLREEHSSNPFVYIEDIDYYGKKLPLYAINGDLAVKDPLIGYISVSETSKMSEREVPKHLMYLREKYGIKKTWTEILDKLFESVKSSSSSSPPKRVYVSPAAFVGVVTSSPESESSSSFHVKYIDFTTGKTVEKTIPGIEQYDLAKLQREGKIAILKIHKVKSD